MDGRLGIQRVFVLAGLLVGACRPSTAHGPTAPPARTPDAEPNSPFDPARARTVLARTDAGPEAAQARLVLARRALDRGRFDEAMAQARAGIDTREAPLEVRLRLAEVGARAAEARARADDVLAFVAAVEPGRRPATLLALGAGAYESLGRDLEAAEGFVAAAFAGAGPADRAYLLDRARQAMARVPPAARGGVAAGGEGPAGACLAALAGDGGSPKAPGCAPVPFVVGALLPRGGRYAGIFETLLAATGAAVEVLGPLRVVWVDPADPTAAVARAEALGARALVGPIDPARVRAAAARAEVPLFVPWGTPSATPRVTYVVPSLDARVAALVGRAKRRRLVILAPAGAFGDRALSAARRAVQEGSGSLAVHRYDPATTSFRPVAEAVGRVRASDALLLLDHATRADNLLRQLRRRGVVENGARILLLGDGLTDDAPRSLQGALAAPPVVPTPADRPFDAAFSRREGRPPPPLARAVFRALRRAAGHPPAEGAGRATVVRVGRAGGGAS